MKTIQVTIAGIGKGLLMNSPLSMLDNLNTTSKMVRSRKTDSYDSLKEQAEKSAYWTENKGKRELYIPSEFIFRSIINASGFVKIGKKSAKTIVAGSMLIEPEKILLGTDKYEMDIRGVVIQRARVIKARAWLPKWKASFKITYNEGMIGDPQILYHLLKEAGERIGIGDFRMQKGGQFGAFTIEKWIEDKKK